MKILVFDTIGRGHHIEYIHHLYMYAGTRMQEHDFIFALSEEFLFMHKEMYFPLYSNIKIIYFKESEIKRAVKGVFKQWRTNYNEYILLKKYIKDYQPDKVVLNALFHYMPFLACSTLKKGLISGILYIIPDRKVVKRSYIKKLADNLRLWMYAKGHIFNKVFLLNDTEYPSIYNHKFNTDVFNFLPDPYVNTNDNSITSIKSIDTKGKRVFLHFGGMGERKGTFDILDAIGLLNKECKLKSIFIFAGVVSNPSMHKKFTDIINKLNADAEILFIEGFVPFEELGNLCSITDYILVPYKNVEQSSGSISHAAQYGKAVIGPEKGLLGYLIKKYKLGIILQQTDGKNLADCFKKLILNENVLSIDGDEYLQICTPENFSKIMFS